MPNKFNYFKKPLLIADALKNKLSLLIFIYDNQARCRFLFLFILNILLLKNSQACTVWGAVMPNEVLIAKNRDFYSENQKFAAKCNKGKYKFFGLYTENQKHLHEFNSIQKKAFLNSKPRSSAKLTLKMGINEVGLVVFTTAASTVPITKRHSTTKHYKQPMTIILENYATVAEIAKNTRLLFQGAKPINYIFADRNEAMVCEIGLNDNYKCDEYIRKDQTKPVIFAQTNHYVFAGLEQYNSTPIINQQTSYERFNTITELLKNNLTNLNFDQFINFSFNTQAKNDDPPAKFDQGYANTYQDNSIFRTFNSYPDRRNKNHPHSERSISAMIIELPKDINEPIKLYLRMINSVTDLNDKNYSQNIKYTAAVANLDQAINNPGAIKFEQKSCKRDINSKFCRT